MAYLTKNAFQSKAHLPLTDRKSNTIWPCNDLDLIYDLEKIIILDTNKLITLISR